MINERYLLCGATGDRGELAEVFVLKIDRALLENVTWWLEEGKKLVENCLGVVDITERGTAEFYVAYDFPDGETSPLFSRIEAWDFLEKPMLLPAGVFELTNLVDYGKVRKTECHGFQVWPDSGHVRLTCYPKEASYRIESTTSIGEILVKLSKNFDYEQLAYPE